MRARPMLLGVIVLCAAVAAQGDTFPTSGTWQELQLAAPPPLSRITAQGADWLLTADKLQSAVPATDPAWQWQTQYVNGTLALTGLGGITDTVTGLTLTNLNNNAGGLPSEFMITGSGTLQYGGAFQLTGTFDAAVSGAPIVTPDPEGLLASGNLTAAELTVTPIDVAVDIKPGNARNPVNITANGVLPVALLGSETLDVSTVDQSTLVLAGAAPKQRGRSGRIGQIEDIDGDGIADILLHFSVRDMTIDPADAALALTGALIDGEPIGGSDSILVLMAAGNNQGRSADMLMFPEPATLTLLAAGALALMRRKRR